MLNANCPCTSHSKLVESKHLVEHVSREADRHDLVILSASPTHTLKETIFGHTEDKIMYKVSKSVLILIKHR